MEALSVVVEDVSWYRVEDSNAPGAVRQRRDEAIDVGPLSVQDDIAIVAIGPQS